MNAWRDNHCVGLVPCSAVTDEKDLILRVFFCQHLQEYVHANGVTVRQNKEKRFTSDWLYCAIYVTIFPYMVAGHRRSNSLCAPAAFGLVDPSKSRLILEHQPYCACLPLLLAFIQHGLLNFFEASHASSFAAFGCFDRGITFRHP